MSAPGAAADGSFTMLEESPRQSFVAPRELTSERAMKDLETMLRSIAASPSHYRNFAVHYMRCRGVLLDEPGRAVLPGYLLQCGTSDKFRDFIILYDASVSARHAFIEESLERCRASLGWTRSYDIFDDEDF